MAQALIRFHRLALREAQRAYRWYGRRSAQAARDFQDEVDRAVQRIAATPNRWPVYQRSDRFVRVRRFPYVLYYRIVDPTQVQIMAVAHARRRPGYWRRRTQP
jgi:plasmid stabilization system protein ParE